MKSVKEILENDLYGDFKYKYWYESTSNTYDILSKLEIEMSEELTPEFFDKFKRILEDLLREEGIKFNYTYLLKKEGGQQ